MAIRALMIDPQPEGIKMDFVHSIAIASTRKIILDGVTVV
jgi:hypothetical protein